MSTADRVQWLLFPIESLMLALVDIAESVNKPLLAWYGSRGDLPWRSDLSDEQLAQLSEEAKAQRAYEVRAP